MTDKTLYMVAMDGSENSARAVDFAVDLAKKTGAGLLIAHVINWVGFRPTSALEVTERPVDQKEQKKYTVEHILNPAAEKARAAGVEVSTYHTWGNPARGLHKKAQNKGASMIIMGRSGHGNIAELVLGSVSNALVHHSKIPVVLVP